MTRLRGPMAGLMLSILLCQSGNAQELNSERIERLFGSYGIAVLEQDERTRLSSLYSHDDTSAVCRTLAFVQYAEPVSAALLDAHREIVSGGSIGATLKRSGWRVSKTNRHIGNFTATAGRVAQLMELRLPQTLALHIYDLTAVRNGREHKYATVVELHHPDYLSVDALYDLYNDLARSPMTVDELRAVRTQLSLKSAGR